MNHPHFNVPSHNCFPEGTESVCESGYSEDYDDISESVDELKEKLNNMKKLLNIQKPSYTLNNLTARKSKVDCSMDGICLSWIFGTILVGVLSVAAYAFFNLYNAVVRKFTRMHDEL